MIVVRVLSTLCWHYVLMLRMAILMLAGLMVGTLLVLGDLSRLLMSVIVGHHRILLTILGVNWLLALIIISMSARRYLLTILIRHIRMVWVSLVDLFILQHRSFPCHR
jgi:hypothetical protein